MLRNLPFLLAVLLGSILYGQDKPLEKTMTPVRNHGWIKLMGTWDEKGQPTLLDLYFTPYANPDSSYITFNARNRLIRRKGGVDANDDGISVQQSSGDTGAVWVGHVINKGEYDGFALKREGLAAVPGILQHQQPGVPKLRLWEEKGGNIRWSVEEAWFVQVDVSTDDGAHWRQLGDQSAGKADLSPWLDQRPLVKVQAFRGLNAYVDFYKPGSGLLADNRLYLLPILMTTDHRNQGRLTHYPSYTFRPTLDLPGSYRASVQLYLDDTKLPFDVAKLFPERHIQMAFRGKWSTGVPKLSTPLFDVVFDRPFLRDPERLKDMVLHRVYKNPKGDWALEYVFPLIPRKPSFPGRNGWVSCKGAYCMNPGASNFDELPELDEFFVLTSDPIHAPIGKQGVVEYP